MKRMTLGSIIKLLELPLIMIVGFWNVLLFIMLGTNLIEKLNMLFCYRENFSVLYQGDHHTFKFKIPKNEQGGIIATYSVTYYCFQKMPNNNI